MTFDVSRYEIEDTAVLMFKNARGDDELIGADGKSAAGVVLYSPGSSQGVKSLNKASRAVQLRMFRTMRGEVSKDDAENAEREQVEKLAGMTKEFLNFPIDASALWGNPKLGYLRKQAEEFIGNYGNFSKGSSPSSGSTSVTVPG